MLSENPIEGAGFKVGERVQVHPAHDRFMMGDRYGKITSISNVAGSTDHVRIRVKLDRSGQSVWFRPDYLMHINPISTRNVLIGVGVVGGLGLLYAMMSAPKAVTPGVPTVITPQVIPPLTSIDDGASQSAHVGDTIQITLPAPTTSTIWVASNDTTGVLQLASSAAVQQTVLAQGGTLQYTVVGVGNDPVTFTLTNTSTGAAVSTLSWTIVASAGSTATPTTPTIPVTSASFATLIEGQATQLAPLLGETYTTVQLPAGGVWGVNPNVSGATQGTSGSIQLTAGTYTLNWTAADGTAQTTSLQVS